jgi:hypothetical protein
VLAVVIPRSTFLKDLISPIHHTSSKAAIKTGPPPHLASEQELHFETVESHQKDGPAQTVEEYMIQNNRWKEVVRAFLLSFENHCRELEEIPKKLLTGKY